MSDFYPPQPLRNAVEDQVGGGTPPRSNPEYWSGPIPWVSVKDFEESGSRICDAQEHISLAGLNACSSKLIPENTPLICTRMAVGRSALAKTAVAINQDVKALFPKAGYSASYLLRILQFVRPVAEAKSVGSTVKGIRIQDYLDIEVHLAPPEAQTFIARLLDTLDTAIQQTEAIVEKLKAVKQGLLHDLLTRGIDANGQLRPPQAEAPHLYKESPLGWIPNEWGCSKARERCSLITKGTTPAAERMWQGNEGFRFLRVDNLTFDGKFDFTASNYRIDQKTHSRELSRSKCIPGDVLTNIVGPPLGKVGLVTNEVGELNVNQAIAIFRPLQDLVPNFLLMWLISDQCKIWLRKRAKQTSGQLNLTLALCQELPIPNVPIEEQRSLIARLESEEKLIQLNAASLMKLKKLKTSLMDDLLTGRVRVTPLLEKAA